jgi:hypothetical protein
VEQVVEMQSIGRPRQYVSPARLYAMFPVLRFSFERGAYVLRFVGESRGPVLRKDRRGRRQREFTGPDRRAGAVDPALASRPQGSVRRIEVADPTPRRGGESGTATGTGSKTTRRRPERADANPRRRQHGRQRRQRPPR